jgi:UDP-2,3-diacylglucosamine pyrophosphatase LpxH
MKGCQPERLLDFLRHHDADTIYLVGDVIDGWALRRSWNWPPSHNLVIQKLLRKARKGTRIVYIPGNHDEFLREHPNLNFGGIEIRLDAIHRTADGRKLLVTHGDQCDAVVRYSPILSLLGSVAYQAVFALGRVVNRIRLRAGWPYWSLSVWAKSKVKDKSRFLKAYELALVAEAKRAGADGVVCGHIHLAGMHEIDGIHYINTGDWVESCTALAETHDGRLALIDWTERAVALDPVDFTRLDDPQAA